MSARCQCHRKCPHILRGSDALLRPEQLARLAPVIGILVDAAYGYDADSLGIDPACGIHGTKVISNEECICRGDRYSALEFVQTLEISIRATGAVVRFEPGHRPRRMKDERPPEWNLTATG